MRAEREHSHAGRRLITCALIRRNMTRKKDVDGVTGPGLPCQQAALATALFSGALRAACLKGGRSSLTWMV